MDRISRSCSDGTPPCYAPLGVYLNNRRVGTLNRESSGAISFSYHDDWLAWKPALRALQTLDNFFEATAQILQTKDASAVTTNHIAQRAGFSIGTLYRYFPDKRAILYGLARREIERQEQAVIAMLRSAEDASASGLVRLCASRMHNIFGGHPQIRRRMILKMARDREVAKLVRRTRESQVRVLEVLQDLLLSRDPVRYRPLSRIQMQIASAGLSGAARVSTISVPEIAEDPAFEEDMADFLERQFLRLKDKPED